MMQLLQSFHGMPFHLVPKLAFGPPVVSLLTLYWGWEFSKELRAIGLGRVGDGPQDSCWVNTMGADIWPLSALSPGAQPLVPERELDQRESVVPGVRGSVA